MGRGGALLAGSARPVNSLLAPVYIASSPGGPDISKDSLGRECGVESQSNTCVLCCAPIAHHPQLRTDDPISIGKGEGKVEQSCPDSLPQ